MTTEGSNLQMKKDMVSSSFFGLTDKVERRLPVRVFFLQKQYPRKILSVTEGRDILRNAIQENRPFMAGRYGTTEGETFFRYCGVQLGLRKKIPEWLKKTMCNNAGFFPNSDELLMKWGGYLEECSSQVDLLGTMKFYGEDWITKYLCPQAKLFPSGGLGSARTGWADALAGKKVLVIHPFENSILYQYQNHRTEIFPGTNMLPEFDLQTIKAVQTIADQEDNRFENWFDALDYMTLEAGNRDFEVALIGCGAYGFPLAARIKQMGKVAIHMGGSLQTLFGITGYRWDHNKSMNGVINPSWTYPDESERPKGFDKVEKGCYW